MLPQLEEKIYSLVPELKCQCRKWKFYCAVIRKYNCSTCKKEWMHGNSWIPTFCSACAKEEWVCQFCGEAPEIHPHHWLPLLAEKHKWYWIWYDWQLLAYINDEYWYQPEITSFYWDFAWLWDAGEDTVTLPKYDFKKPLSEQSEEFRTWLLENIK